MKILYDAIPKTGLILELDDPEWFPEHDCLRVGGVSAKVSLTRQGQRVFLDGHLSFVCRFVCDSCLELYLEPQDFFFKMEFEYRSAHDPYWQSEDQQCFAGEMDVEFLREPEIDLSSVLAQQVVLSAPVKRLCSQSCRGLCPCCGLNLNKEQCACRDQKTNSPFQVLTQVKGR